MKRTTSRILAGVLAAILSIGAAGTSAYAWNGHVNESPNSPHSFQYLDAHGNKHSAEENIHARKRILDVNDIDHHVAQADYTGEDYTIQRGVDVSEWTGSIDWAKVKAGGYDFAFIRIGYTGGRGGCYADKKGMTNLRNAQAAGLDVGVYFFSLAINEKEAQNEANWVIKQLGGAALQLPVMYDPEYVLGKTTRNDNLSGAQFTANAVAFCSTIQAAGYEAGVYANMIFECNLYDMTQIEQYHVWFADYEPKPQSPYYYEYWQYNGNGGRVPGISGTRIDLNLRFIPTTSGLEKEQKEETFKATGIYELPDVGVTFDANYYLNKYPEVLTEKDGGSTYEDALYNYLHTGVDEGRYASAEHEEECERQGLEESFARLSAETGISIEELKASYYGTMLIDGE